MLIDFPYHVNEVRLFENINRKFTKFIELDPCEDYMYSKQYTSNMYFLETQRRIQPSMEYSLEEQLQTSKRYWVIIGPQGCGKTTVAKFMAEKYGLEMI